MAEVRLSLSKRTCDGCDLCCTACAVDDLNKPPGVRCEHLCGEPGKSCSIYERRPRDCSGFICAWRMGDQVLGDWAKPSECGFVITFDCDAMALRGETPLLVTVHMDPDRPDAWNTPEARKLFRQIARDVNVIVAIGSRDLAHTLFSPRGRVFTRAKHPYLFSEDHRVGLPSTEFLPDFLSPERFMAYFMNKEPALLPGLGGRTI